MRGTSDLGARASAPAVQTRRLRRGGEGVRIEVMTGITAGTGIGMTMETNASASATLMPEAGRVPLSGAFLRAAVETAWQMAGGVALTVSSPAVTPLEARSFADAGFVTTSELHLLTHDLTAPGQGDRARHEASSVRLRRGTVHDIAAALRVDEAAFAPGWTMTPHGLANARSATPVTRLRVADRRRVDRARDTRQQDGPDRRVVGYALTGRAGRRGYLQRLAVDPSNHRCGIGSALVIDAIRWCRRRGVQRLVVNTQVGNEPALELYRRMGFAESTSRLYTMEYRTPAPPA